MTKQEIEQLFEKALLEVHGGGNGRRIIEGLKALLTDSEVAIEEHVPRSACASWRHCVSCGDHLHDSSDGCDSGFGYCMEPRCPRYGFMSQVCKEYP